MDLDELLDLFDRATANLDRLAAVWLLVEEAHSVTSTVSDAGYGELVRVWLALREGLPPIDGFTVTAGLPPAATRRSNVRRVDNFTTPPDQIEDYRYRLARARRNAIRRRLQELLTSVDIALHQIDYTPEGWSEELFTAETSTARDSVREIERLLGDALDRAGRWYDLQRHLRFGERGDWFDIAEMDWPEVRPRLEAAAYDENDPLPIPAGVDLGTAAAGDVTGSATTALRWEQLNDDQFERFLFDLLRALPDYENVQWLMRTRAPDRGRDLSLDRILRDGGGSNRREHVIVQAKHWMSRSVALADVAATIAGVATWQPPLVRGVIIAASGRFSADAVTWVEHHNEKGAAPLVELWPDSQLEALLTRFPQLAVGHGLR